MMIHEKVQCWAKGPATAVILLLNILPCGAQAIDNNLNFNGTLVSEPCDPDPRTTNFVVDFGTVVKKSLYLNTRTESTPFSINLLNCDTAISQSVVFTFTGSESTVLPGMLAVANPVAGIVIGLESADGKSLPVNQPAPALSLAQGTNSFHFNAYVSAEPEAIKNQTIITGQFSATATVEIAYP